MPRRKDAAGAGETGSGGATTADEAAAAEFEGLSFEEALRSLEEVVARLEQGEQPLEEALGLFEKGIRLSRLLTRKLEKAQARIDKVVETRDGSRLEPFTGAKDEP